MDELTHLKRLSAVKTNAGVKFLTPAAFPGSHCPLHTALALSANIKGMSTLVVGTAECGTYSRTVVYKSKYKDSSLHWTYVLDASEVVFGCRRGLIEAIRAMAAAGAKAVMLILTCVPEVIGEDVEGIVHEIQPEVTARLSFVQLGHFKCNSYPSGFWKTLTAFGAMMEPAETRAKVINVLGRSPEEDHIPLPTILDALSKRGFTLRMLAPKSDMDDFLAAPDAALSLVLSPYMNPLAEQMQRAFGIPYLSLHEVYSVAGIDALLDELAERLGIDWGDAFAAKREKALLLEEEAKAAFPGVSYVVTPGCTLSPLPLALYLDTFQMSPFLLHVEEFYPDDRRWAKALLEKEIDPLLCHMVNNKADAAVLERLAPALSFGEIPEGSGAVPAVSYLYEMYGQAGYERTALLLSRMLKAGEGVPPRRGRREDHGNP
jgi:nitrogenase molybdenum-iron protein alpha/beta subunit